MEDLGRSHPKSVLASGREHIIVASRQPITCTNLAQNKEGIATLGECSREPLPKLDVVAVRVADLCP
jgi:hypothetical protein